MNSCMRAIICLLLVAGSSLSAEITRVYDLKKVEQELVDQDSLVMFDVDDTLISIREFRDFKLARSRKLLEHFCLSKEENDLVWSKMLANSTSMVIDSESVKLINKLQQQGVPVIAFTALYGGKKGVIESVADWRIKDLKSHGFDFSSEFPELLVFSKSEGKSDYPMFKQGVLFSAKHEKGPVLQMMLEALQWKPSKIIFIDDRIDYIQSVESVVHELGINFVGFEYKAADQLPDILDEELFLFQINYFLEHKEWLTNEEARKKQSCYTH